MNKEQMGRLLLEASTGMHGDVAKQLVEAWSEMAGEVERLKEAIATLSAPLTPPAGWGEWAMRKAQQIEPELFRIETTPNVARNRIHVALIEAMRFATGVKR